jgi:O-antigen/teichoic acid export membrane protein
MREIKRRKIVAGEVGGMLPGIAGICLYMLVVALIGVVGVFRGVYQGEARYVVLPVCTLIVVGVFGLLRLRRWGWALVMAGALLMSAMYGFMARTMHQPGMWVMAGLDFCFFLYLVRPETRERLR